MGEFKVEKSVYKIPAEDSYFLDLIWIEPVDFGNGPAYKWHWKLSDIEAQKEWKDVPVMITSITSRTPTLENRFGKFFKALTGNLAEGETGSTEELAMASFRVKGFIEHKEVKVEGKAEPQTFCNVTKLIENTAKKGEGEGINGASNKLRPIINEYLAKVNKPLLKIEEEKEKTTSGQAQKTTTRTDAPKKKDISW